MDWMIYTFGFLMLTWLVGVPALVAYIALFKLTEDDNNG